MNDELQRGIPKAIPIGEKKVFTQAEKDRADADLLKILKEYGMADENETIESWKAKSLSYDEWIEMKDRGMKEDEWIAQRENNKNKND